MLDLRYRITAKLQLNLQIFAVTKVDKKCPLNITLHLFDFD
jgi:hypothetical protein